MINNEIKAEKVRLVGSEDYPVVMMLSEAIKKAEELDLDVICINPVTKDNIPIVKIEDYNKFIYEKQKKEKENRKKARLNAVNTKEIHISDVIAENDLKTKAKNADRIINSGDSVRLIITYKGRSIKLINQGPEKLQTLVNLMTSNYKIDKTPQIKGNKVIMTVAPNK